jgi:hypothetical protein
MSSSVSIGAMVGILGLIKASPSVKLFSFGCGLRF